MSDKNLFILEHKTLPFLVLTWREGISDLLKNFSFFASKLSKLFYKPSDFPIINSEEALVHIAPFVQKKDKVVVLSVPFTESVDYIGFAKYIYVLYEGDCLNVRFFLFELMHWNNGMENFFRYCPVEYKLISKNKESYHFERKTYLQHVWWGK